MISVILRPRLTQKKAGCSSVSVLRFLSPQLERARVWIGPCLALMLGGLSLGHGPPSDGPPAVSTPAGVDIRSAVHPVLQAAYVRPPARWRAVIQPRQLMCTP